MAGEIQVPFQTGKTVYALIRDRNAKVWNTSGGVGAFESYLTANFSSYTISLTEQGTSAYFAGAWPSAIPAGVYNLVAKSQTGGSPAETDTTIAQGSEQWNGTALAPLSDTATSGQLGQGFPSRIARGTMVQNFPLYFKSAADHVSPFTSGVVSGQIQRDAGTTWNALQSGTFTEVGQGFYFLQALTSGDLLANTARLLFTATGVSGGAADPVPITLVLQRTSGQ
jgi:hypothetical protein